MNTEAQQDAYLEDLVEAELAKKEGRIPKSSALAMLPLENIEEEIQKLGAQRAHDLGLEHNNELIDILRAEVKATQSTPMSKRTVISKAGDIVGELQRRSWWWVVSLVLLGVGVPFLILHQWAIALAFGLLAFTLFDWEGRGIRRLYKNPVGGLAYWQKNQWVPIEPKQYQHVRAYYESDMEIPVLVVFQQKPIRTLWTSVRSHLLPRSNDQHLVISLGSSWRNEQGQWVAAGALDGVFQKLCEQAGYQLTFHTSSFTKASGWSGKRTL